jgi:hypothetical protein
VGVLRTLFVVLLAALLVGCLSPQDRRPGLMLPGRAISAPDDWTFTDAHREIAVQVQPPHLIPHSVTVWCASVDGKLYLAARDPDTKNWPGWVARDPRVRIGIEGSLYDGRLVDVTDATETDAVSASYQTKYGLADKLTGVRLWRFEP